MKRSLAVVLFSILALISVSKAGKDVKSEPFFSFQRGQKEDVVPHDESGGIQARIVNGAYAAEKQIPYQVGLLIGYENNVYGWCGGSLIGNEWVLTAAHCTSGGKSFEVRLGSIYSNKPLLTVSGYENHVHEGWANKTDDIALIKIPKVEYNEYIAPAVLPHIDQARSLYVSAKATASGWGSINDKREKTDRLKYVNLTVIDGKTCARSYGPNAAQPHILCADTKGTGSTCYGDSGGPLILDKSRLLIGLATFVSAGSCSKGYPAGFSRVTYYLDWIKRVSGISR